jgi:hypothetical protein
MIMSDEDETPGIKARELGIEHAVAVTGMYGEYSPYLNMSHMPGLTFVYIVGREGGIVWKGDPSRDTDEFLEALAAALSGPRMRPVPEIPGEAAGEELADARIAYVTGDLAKARKLAEKAASKFAKKKGEEAAAIAGGATALVEAVDGTLADLTLAFDTALESGDPEATCQALRDIQRAFPRSEASSAAEDALGANEELAASVAAWSAWLELAETRPPSFPARHEKLEKRYAKDLEKYLKKTADGPGGETAKAWLERYEAAG